MQRLEFLFLVFACNLILDSDPIRGLALTHILTHNRKNQGGNSGTKKFKRNLTLNKKCPRVLKVAPWALLVYFVISRSCVRVTSVAPAQKFPLPLRFPPLRGGKLRRTGNFFAFRPQTLRWFTGGGDGGTFFEGTFSLVESGFFVSETLMLQNSVSFCPK